MKKDIFKKISAAAVLGLIFFPLLALAQVGSVPGPIITSPTQIQSLVQKVFYFLAAIVLTIALIMLLYAAILYLTAGASETTLTKAKSVLIYAIVGIVIAVLTFSVIPFIETVLRGMF